jgi:UDP-glucose 4-epimerase
MRILVTGGAGFIGSQVVDAYLEAGHQVVVLDDLSTGKRENLNPAAELWELDVAGPEAARAVAAGGFQVVNHHAAQVSVPYSVEHPLEDLRVNGRGALNLLAAAAAGGARRFIFISSGGAVYGEQERLPISEQTPPRPLSPYAVHKLLGESYLPHFRAEHGLETVVLRYANVYGPRQSPHAEAGVVAIFCQALVAGRPVTVYRHPDMPRGMIRDYVYVGDCVAANLAALERGDGGVFNIGTGRPTATLDLWEELCRAAGGGAEPGFGPPRPGDLRRSLLDSDLARRELGWRPTVELAQGAALTLRWQREQAGGG